MAGDRAHLLRFTVALQEHKRSIHPNRKPADEMAEDHLARLERMVREQQGRTLIAEIDGRTAGFACVVVGTGEHFETDEKFGWLTDIYVEPAFRGRGVGQALIAAAEAHVRKLGLRSVRIYALADNPLANNAYRRAGYRPYEISFEKDLDGPP